MSWYRNGLNVKYGITGTLHYKFKPRREDHTKIFTCAISVNSLDIPFRKAVTLNVKCDIN